MKLVPYFLNLLTNILFSQSNSNLQTTKSARSTINITNATESRQFFVEREKEMWFPGPNKSNRIQNNNLFLHLVLIFNPNSEPTRNRFNTQSKPECFTPYIFFLTKRNPAAFRNSTLITHA